jgi:hypothetical protein
MNCKHPTTGSEATLLSLAVELADLDLRAAKTFAEEHTAFLRLVSLCELRYRHTNGQNRWLKKTNSACTTNRIPNARSAVLSTD